MLWRMTWWEYLQRHQPEGMSQMDIAERAGVDQTTVSRWKNGKGVAAPATAIKLARSLGLEPVEVLLAAGHLTVEEAKASVSLTAPANLTDSELLDLLRDRLTQLRAGERDGTPSTAKTPARDDLAGPVGPPTTTWLATSPDEEPLPPSTNPPRARPHRRTTRP